MSLVMEGHISRIYGGGRAHQCNIMSMSQCGLGHGLHSRKETGKYLWSDNYFCDRLAFFVLAFSGSHLIENFRQRVIRSFSFTAESENDQVQKNCFTDDERPHKASPSPEQVCPLDEYVSELMS